VFTKVIGIIEDLCLPFPVARPWRTANGEHSEVDRAEMTFLVEPLQDRKESASCSVDDIDRVLVMDGEIEPASRTYNSLELQEPRVRKIIDMREDRSRVDQVEIGICEGEMRKAGGGDEFKGRAKMLLTSDNVGRLDVHTPDFGGLCEVVKCSDHHAVATAKIQYPALWRE